MCDFVMSSATRLTFNLFAGPTPFAFAGYKCFPKFFPGCVAFGVLLDPLSFFRCVLVGALPGALLLIFGRLTLGFFIMVFPLLPL
jgi:hypothetical protein